MPSSLSATSEAKTLCINIDMKKFNYLILLILLFSIDSFSQDLTCKDFKTGEFYIPAENETESKYSVTKKDGLKTYSEEFIEKHEPVSKYVVIRKETTQIEWDNGIDVGDPLYEKIEWIDDCSYRLTYDETTSELSEDQKLINQYNGIVVEKISIEGNCMEYKATMTLEDGYKVVQKGTICKKAIK